MFLTRKSRKQRLTPEQIELFKIYQEKWLNVAQSTRPANQEQVEFAVYVLYRKFNLPCPQIDFFQGPKSFSKAKIYRTKQEKWRSGILGFTVFLIVAAISVSVIASFGLLFNPVLYKVMPAMKFLLPGFLVFITLLDWLDRCWRNIFFLNSLRSFAGLILILWTYLGPSVSFLFYPENFSKEWAIGSAICSLLMIAYFELCSYFFTLKNRPCIIPREILIRLNPRKSSLIQQLDTLVIKANANELTRKQSIDTSSSASQRLYHSYSSALKWIYVRDGGLQSWYAGYSNECFLAIEQSNQYALIDFCIQELGFDYDHELWEASLTLIQECGVLLLLSRSCYICDRPSRLEIDAEQRLHAVASPAIEFADSTCVYAYQGILLPEKYGKVHPQEWQSQWVLEESNAELRRLLIQHIGYERLCQEVEAKVLDQWREYELLQITFSQKAYVNGRQVIEEPVVLLKMTCPSTEHIHVLRVPPIMRSAKEAATWINHGIAPNKFIAET
jgi:hypothetical protein